MGVRNKYCTLKISTYPNPVLTWGKTDSQNASEGKILNKIAANFLICTIFLFLKTCSADRRRRRKIFWNYLFLNLEINIFWLFLSISNEIWQNIKMGKFTKWGTLSRVGDTLAALPLSSEFTIIFWIYYNART